MGNRASVAWEQFERNQVMLTDNAHMKSRMEPKAARGGRSLLAGLLRCRRCGRMLHVAYSGSHGEVPRYHCRGAHINHGGEWCISFGGLRPDRAVAAEILKAVEGNAIKAALEVAARVAEQQRQRHQMLSLELQQAHYEVRLAARRYEAVDPLCCVRGYVTFPAKRPFGGPLPRFQEHIITGTSRTPSGF